MRNKDKTHCKHGHDLQPADSHWVVVTKYEDGSELTNRVCKACQKRRTQAWLEKKGKVVKRTTK